MVTGCATSSGTFDSSSSDRGLSHGSDPVSLVSIPTINKKVDHVQTLAAKSRDVDANWETSFQILGAHDKFNQALGNEAQKLLKTGRAMNFSKLALQSSIPVAAGNAICERLALEVDLPGAVKTDQAGSQKTAITANGESAGTGTKQQESAQVSAKKSTVTPTQVESAKAGSQATSAPVSTKTKYLESKTLCTEAGEDKVTTSAALFDEERIKELTQKVAGALAKANKLDVQRIANRTSGSSTKQSPYPSASATAEASQSPSPSEEVKVSSQQKAAESLPALPELFEDVVFDDAGAAIVILPQGIITSPQDGQLAVRIESSNLNELLSATGKRVAQAAKDHQVFAGLQQDPANGTQFKALDLDELVDCAKEKCVALTYDDGPGPNTPKLLDTLKAEGVKASFLIIGPHAQTYPDTIRREIREGHALGAHTCTHPPLSRRTPNQIKEEIRCTINAIDEAQPNYQVAFTRPPYGDGAFGKGDTTVINTLKELDQAIVMWDVDTLDWKHRDPAKVLEKIKEQVHPGSIILMHDIHDASIEAAKSYIRYLKQQGYVFVTVPQLFDNHLEPGKRYFDLNTIR